MYRPVVRQVLTRHHRQQRCLWAQTHRRWTRQDLRKTLTTRSAALVNITTVPRLVLVCLDLPSLENATRNILVVTVHFTCYAQAYVTKVQKASTMSRVLWEKLFIHYGRSTAGPQLAGVNKSSTSPYHPQGNPQSERLIRTLLNDLGTF